MSRDFDISRPHPGSGLIFSGEPAPHAEVGERAARHALLHFCAACGCSDACFGFGVTSRTEGLWSCNDADCLAQVRAEANRAVQPLVGRAA